MPIKPENKALYPPQWPAISNEAKQRAGWRCQHPGCTAQQYDVGFWRGEAWEWSGRFDFGMPGAYARAKQYAAEQQFAHTGDDPDPDPRYIVIVLTTMHLDHDPSNCDPGNLLVACQRHHQRYDAKHHVQTAYTTRMKKRGNLELDL
jgi:hypothetical protein